jgi:hypothetical protein
VKDILTFDEKTTAELEKLRILINYQTRGKVVSSALALLHAVVESEQGTVFSREEILAKLKPYATTF